MIRLEGAAGADLLAKDFTSTFSGKPRAWKAELAELRLISLDGRSNAAGFAPILELIETAAASITVISPYLTFPFTNALARAARRGVAVRLITPWPNNKPLVRDALLATAAKAGFEVRLLPAMIHLKALLIDETKLVVGSSNFDFVSLAAEEELLAVISRPSLVEDFRRRIVEPALSVASPAVAQSPSALAGAAASLALRLAAGLVQAARFAPRGVVEWTK